MSNAELASRKEKIFELAKLLAQHIAYLEDSERVHVQSVVAEKMGFQAMPLRMTAAA